MPPRAFPRCVECHRTESLLWRRLTEGQICQECFVQKEKQATDSASENSPESLKANDDKTKDRESQEGGDQKFGSSDEKQRLRKSTRAARFRNRSTNSVAIATAANGLQNAGGSNNTHSNGYGANSSNKLQQRGRNRRNLFKKTPMRTPIENATTHFVNSVFHKDIYFQLGDIVSLVDSDLNIYYAQVRGLLVDNYGEKSAFLTWLIPTQSSPDPRETFDPATYLIGPDEDQSRKLSSLEFVMHAPSDYYLDRSTPFPPPDSMDYESKKSGYIWTTMPEIHRKKSV